MRSGFINQPNQPQMPSDLEAEQAVLGSILMDNDALDDAMKYLKPKDFYSMRNQVLYDAMLHLAEKNQHIDSTTLHAYLARRHKASYIGSDYIAKLDFSQSSSKHVIDYAKIVKDKSILRQYIAIGQAIQNEGYQQRSIKDISTQSEDKLLTLASNSEQTGPQPIGNVVSKAFAHYTQLENNSSKVTGLPIGYKDIDTLTTGLHPNELLVLAARPAMGKTTLAVNIAQHVAQNRQIKNNTVLIFSVEMSAESIVSRMICAQGRINAQHWRTGTLTKTERVEAVNAIGKLAQSHIYIDDTPGINITSLIARSKRLAKRVKNLGLIVVDYLQLVQGNDKESRQQEVSEVSRKLKVLSRTLHVPVIALSQLSRSVEQRENKRPVLSDIRESGSIEQDADIVAFLYRADYYKHQAQQHQQKSGKNLQQQQQQIQKQRDKKGDASITEFIIEKNRSGPRGTINLVFLKTYNDFESISKQDSEAINEIKNQ